MPIILVNDTTGGLYEAKDQRQADAMARNGWKPVDSSRGLSKAELVAEAKAAGVTVDETASKAEVAEKLAKHGAP